MVCLLFSIRIFLSFSTKYYLFFLGPSVFLPFIIILLSLLSLSLLLFKLFPCRPLMIFITDFVSQFSFTSVFSRCTTEDLSVFCFFFFLFFLSLTHPLQKKIITDSLFYFDFHPCSLIRQNSKTFISITLVVPHYPRNLYIKLR